MILYPLLLTGHLSTRANAVLDTVALMVSRCAGLMTRFNKLTLKCYLFLHLETHFNLVLV